MPELIPLALLATWIAWLVLRERKIRRVVNEWTSKNHLVLVRQYQTWFRFGPLRLWGGKYAVRYLRVRDEHGVERNVWLRIGDYLLGMIDDTVEPIWE